MNPLFCAIDSRDLFEAEKLASALHGSVGGLKLGLEFFMAHGAEGYRKIAAKGLPVFLDVKLNDIPNTVAGALRSLLPLKPSFLTLHANGGGEMMRAAAEVASQAEIKPKLLAVTVLTSLDGANLESLGQDQNVERQVVRLAKLAKESGMDGVICSPQEVSALRAALGKDFILMVPGIRPVWAEAQDQKRTMTPKEAMKAGASHLVIGRPITKASNPSQAAMRILAELA